MKNISSALVKAQKTRDLAMESRLLKQMADQAYPVPAVNASSALPMPERFLSKLVFGAIDCWIWRGCVDEIGYGRFPYKGENKAHRVAYSLFVGPIPDRMMVLHKCDNRQCVNPEHLFLGTQSDNMQDMVSKGRNAAQRLLGERNPMARLTQKQVDEIRIEVAAGATQRSMCDKYEVSPMTISRIVRRQAWN